MDRLQASAHLLRGKRSKVLPPLTIALPALPHVVEATQNPVLSQHVLNNTVTSHNLTMNPQNHF